MGLSRELLSLMCLEEDEEEDEEDLETVTASTGLAKKILSCPILGRDTQILGLDRPSTMAVRFWSNPSSWSVTRNSFPLKISPTSTLAAKASSSSSSPNDLLLTKSDRTLPAKTTPALTDLRLGRGTTRHLRRWRLQAADSRDRRTRDNIVSEASLILTTNSLCEIFSEPQIYSATLPLASNITQTFLLHTA